MTRSRGGRAPISSLSLGGQLTTTKIRRSLGKASVLFLGVAVNLVTLAGSIQPAGAFSPSVPAGTDTQIGFVTAPASTVAGTAFAQQPLLALLDANGRLASAGSVPATYPVAISLTGGTGTGTLTCDQGIANETPTTFDVGFNIDTRLAILSGCSIDQSSTSPYTITATGTDGSVGSTPITITPGAAHHVIWSTLGSATAGTPIGPLTVTILDALNNVVTNSTAIVALAAAGPAGATLSCDGSSAPRHAAVAGVATFGGTSGCVFTKAGTTHLVATVSGLAGTFNSPDFGVSATAATNSLSADAPKNTFFVAGSSNPIDLNVYDLDQYGNVSTHSGDTVVLSIQSGPAGALMTACNQTFAVGPPATCTWATTAGVAGFTGLLFDHPGTYVLDVSQTGLNALNSASFYVTPTESGHVVFGRLPNSTGPGAPGSIAINTPFTQTVSLTDGAGHINTADSSSVVTLAVIPNFNCDSIYATAVAGVATFTNCRFTGSTGVKNLDAFFVPATNYTGAVGQISANLSVYAGPADHLLVTPQHTPTTSGTAQTITVQTVDIGGNLTTYPNLTGQAVTIATNDSSPSFHCTGCTQTFGTNNYASIPLTLQSAGTRRVTATSGALTGATDITVNPGTATQVLVRVAPGQSGTVGSGHALYLQAFRADPASNFVNEVTSSATWTIDNNVAGAGATNSCDGVSATSTPYEYCFFTGALGAHLVRALDSGSGFTGTLTVNTVADSPVQAAFSGPIFGNPMPVNGDFESGTSSWSFAGGAYVAGAGFEGQSARMPWYGGEIFQDNVQVPAGGGTLSFWYNSYTGIRARIYTTSTSTLLAEVPNLAGTSGSYRLVTYDLGALAGQVVRLDFTHYRSCCADTVLDDVSIGPGHAAQTLAVNPAVVLTDAWDHPGASAPGATVALSLASPADGIAAQPASASLLGCPSAVDASSGTASFAGCILYRASERASDTYYHFKVSLLWNGLGAPAFANGLSAPFTLAAGTINSASLSFSAASSYNGGTAFGTQPVVTYRDAAGNVPADDWASITTVAFRPGTPASGTGTLSGCTNLTARAGVSDWSTCPLSIDKVGNGYVLQFTTSHGNPTMYSNPFDIVVGPVNSLRIVQQPTTTTVNQVINPTTGVDLQELDLGGNILVGSGDTITAHWFQPGTLNGNLTRSANAQGLFVFANLSPDTAMCCPDIYFTDSAGPAVYSNSFNIPAATAAPAQLSFTNGLPAQALGGSVFTSQPGFVEQDTTSVHNTINNNTDYVSLAISPLSGSYGNGATLTCTANSLQLSGGYVQFSGCTIDKVGQYQLRATAPNAGFLDSDTITVLAGPPTALTVSPSTGPYVAGAAQNLTVTAVDLGGNLADVTGNCSSLCGSGGPYTGNITLSTNDPRVSSQAHALSGNVWTFSGTPVTATETMPGTALTTWSASGSGLTTGTSPGETVLPAATNRIFLSTTSAPPITPGAILSADDAVNGISFYGLGYDGAFGSTGNFTSVQTLTAGTPSICGTVVSGHLACATSTPGVYTVNATGPFPVTAGTLTVNPGALTRFTFSSVTSSITAGQAAQAIASAVDQFGNVITNYSRTNAVSTNEATPHSNSSVFNSGVGNVAIPVTQVGTGTVNVSVTDSSAAIHSSFPVSVSPAALNSLRITAGGIEGGNTTITAGSTAPYGANGYDVYNNLIGAVTGATTFTISPHGTGTGAQCTLNVCGATRTANSPYTITGIDGAVGTVQAASLSVNPANVASIVFTANPASRAAGSGATYTVNGFDIYGNNVGDVTSGTVFTIGAPGSCTANVCQSTQTGNYTVTASYPGATAITSALSVVPAALDHLTIAPTSTTVGANTVQSYVVNAYDQYSNLIGNVTTAASFAVSPDGSCSANSCWGTAAGTHTVTATYTLNSVTRQVAATLGVTVPRVYTMDNFGHVFANGGNGSQTVVLPSDLPWSYSIARTLLVRSDHLSGFVVDGYGAVHPWAVQGTTLPGSPALSAYYGALPVPAGAPQNSDIITGAVLLTDNSGYTIDKFGGVHPFGGAPGVFQSDCWSPGFSYCHDQPSGAAKAVGLVLNSTSCFGYVTGYLLDNAGGLHSFWDSGHGVNPGNPSQIADYPFGFPAAVGVQSTGCGRGFVADVYGGVHGYGGQASIPNTGLSAYYGSAPIPSGAPVNYNIIRSFVLSSATQGYTLDGFGGPHPFATSAGAIPPTESGALVSGAYTAGSDNFLGIGY